MQVEFLGSGHGIPSAERYCNSILVTVGEGCYLIDAGAPVLDLLLRRGYPLESLRAVFFTHLHSDHVNGYFHLINQAHWAFTRLRFGSFFPEAAGAELTRQYIAVTERDNLDESRLPLHVYEPGVIFDDGRLRVTAFRTAHAAAKGFLAYGFLLEAEGKRILFTGDMAHDISDFPAKEAAGADLLVTELAHGKPEVLFEKLKAAGAAVAVLNHVYPLPKADAILARQDEIASKLIMAADGTVITL